MGDKVTEKVEGITLAFQENSQKQMRQDCVEMVKDLLKESNFEKPIKKQDLVNLLQDGYVKDYFVMEKDEKGLSEKSTSFLKGKIMEIISPEEISVQEILKIMKDLNVFFPNKNEAEDLYAVKIDKTQTKTHIKIMLIR